MRKKMIEEMAKDLEEKVVIGWRKELYVGSAETLYNAGYRKIPEGAVVLTREEWEKYQTTQRDWNAIYFDGIEQARKEMARKFARLAKQKIDEVISDIILSRPPTNDDESEVVRKQVLSAITSPLKKIRDEKIDEICKELVESE